MSEYILHNDQLTVKFTPQASEWTSIRDRRGIEYAWAGDPAWWTGRNPTLFPIVGRLINDTYRLAGRQYHLGNHGFARHQLFAARQPSTTSLEMTLEATPETRAVYPFDFRLTNHYQLTGRQLRVTTSVLNLDSQPLPHALGAHPALRCPLEPGEDLRDYRLVFPEIVTLRRRLMRPDSQWEPDSQVWATVRELPLSPELFAKDVVAFERPKFTSVSLCSPRHRVVMDFGERDFFALWTKPGAPFLCLEPWDGLGDEVGFAGELTAKAYLRLLPPGQTHTLDYTLTFD